MTESEVLNKLHAKIVSSKFVEDITEQEMMVFCKAKTALEDVQQYRAIGTVEECQAAVEKQIPKKPKHTYIKHGKHTWKKDKNGEIDNFAWGFDYHNGVVCEVCGKTVCVHCNPNYDKLEDCEVNIYNCPSCDKEVCYNQKHCDCGQLLDWSGEE